MDLLQHSARIVVDISSHFPIMSVLIKITNSEKNQRTNTHSHTGTEFTVPNLSYAIPFDSNLVIFIRLCIPLFLSPTACLPSAHIFIDFFVRFTFFRTVRIFLHLSLYWLLPFLLLLLFTCVRRKTILTILMHYVLCHCVYTYVYACRQSGVRSFSPSLPLSLLLEHIALFHLFSCVPSERVYAYCHRTTQKSTLEKPLLSCSQQKYFPKNSSPVRRNTQKRYNTGEVPLLLLLLLLYVRSALCRCTHIYTDTQICGEQEGEREKDTDSNVNTIFHLRCE